MKRFLMAAFVAAVFLTAAGEDASAQLLRRSRVVAEPAPVVVVVEQSTETKRQPGPIFCDLVRTHLAKELRKSGMGRIEALKKANEVTDAEIAELMPSAERASGQKLGAIGDGKILQALIDFLKSPQGQALMDALVKLLISLIAWHDSPESTWGSALRAWNA